MHKMNNILLIITFLTLPMFTIAWSGYQGIPSPPWPSDLDVQRPSLPNPWNSNTSGFWYIKNGGTNSGNGYPGDPRDSIDPSSLSAGDVVVIEVGTEYPDNETFSIDGTSENPIWIISSESGTKVTCSGDFSFSADYYIFNDLEFDSGSRESALYFSNASFILVRNCSVTYTHDGSNGAGFGISSGASNIIIYKCNIGPLGNYQYIGDLDIDQHGIVFGSGSSYCWIINNTISKCQGDGIQVGGDGYDPSTLNHIYIVGNSISDCNQTGLWAKRSEFVVFAYNDISRMGYYTSGGGGGAAMGGQYPGQHLWMIYNICHDCARGVDIHEKTSANVIQNVLYNIWGESGCQQWGYGALHFRVTGTYYALHNTVYDATAYITTGGSGTKYYRNNIFYGFKETSCFQIDTDGSPSVQHLDYNLYPSDQVDIDWEEGDGDTYNSLAAFSVAEGEEVNRIIGNPQFTNAENADFNIGVASDAINSSFSSDGTIYELYETTFGASIWFDIAGNPRPVIFNDWDVGAYEYTAGGLGNMPAKPTMLRIIKSDQCYK